MIDALKQFDPSLGRVLRYRRIALRSARTEAFDILLWFSHPPPPRETCTSSIAHLSNWQKYTVRGVPNVLDDSTKRGMFLFSRLHMTIELGKVFSTRHQLNLRSGAHFSSLVHRKRLGHHGVLSELVSDGCFPVCDACCGEKHCSRYHHSIRCVFMFLHDPVFASGYGAGYSLNEPRHSARSAA